MQKTSLLTFSLVLILALASCSSTPTPGPTIEPTSIIKDDSFRTLVAGTLTAIAESATPTQEILPTGTETPTEQPLPATEEPSPFPTKEVVSISINENLNCRKGPETYYPIVEILNKGARVDILGRDQSNAYFFVRNPSSTNNGCWIYGSFATVTGNIEILPVFTAQPTPQPTFTPAPPPTSFTVAFVGLTECGSGFAANFNITNTGTIKLDSVRIQNKLAGTSDLFIHVSDFFTQWSLGALYLKHSDLLVRESAIVSTCQPGGFTTDPSGQKVNSKVTVCTRNGLAGTCYSQELSFTP